MGQLELTHEVTTAWCAGCRRGEGVLLGDVTPGGWRASLLGPRSHGLEPAPSERRHFCLQHLSWGEEAL